MDFVHIIDGLIGIIVLGGGYYITTQAKELKRVEWVEVDNLTKSENKTEKVLTN